MPSQKAWLEIASDDHSRIFTTLLPQTVYLILFFCLLYIPTPYRTSTLERERKKQKVGIGFYTDITITVEKG